MRSIYKCVGEDIILPHEIDFCWESPNSYTIQRVREDDILPYEKIKDDHVGET